MGFKRLIRNLLICSLLTVILSCGAFNFSKSPKDTALKNDCIPQDRVTALKKRVASLEKALKKSTDQVKHKNELIAVQQNKLAALEKLINKSKQNPKKARIDYKNPEILYKKARNLLVEAQYTNAADHFSTFINHYPDHSLADNAVYWLGECYYSQGNYQQAVFVFKNLVKKYPKSEKVPDALLKIGYSYLSIDDVNRAHHFLKEVIKKYPFSPASEKAQEKLGEYN